MHLKYYKLTPDSVDRPIYVLNCKLPFRLGMIHMSHWKWWRPIFDFIRCLPIHLKLALKKGG